MIRSINSAGNTIYVMSSLINTKYYNVVKDIEASNLYIIT